jgi:polysaccharide transporter, PST family
VVLLLGQKWAPAGPLLCIFAVRGIAHSIERTMGWIHVATGRADRWMRWGMYSAVVQLAALMVGLPFGVTGVATSYAVAMFILFVPALVYSGRPIGIRSRDVLQAVGPQTIAGLIAVAAGFLVELQFLADFSQLMRILVSGMVCLVTYLAVAVGVFRVTAPLHLVFSALRNLRAVRMPASSRP